MKRILFAVLLLLSCLSIHAESVYYGFAELTLDESFTYRFVKAMDAESKKAIDYLLAGKNETEDKSIIKRADGEWYVRKGYSLPEGNYYESFLYVKDDGYVNIILPRITVIIEKGYQIDELLEHLGDKVTLGSGSNDYGNRYYLDCQVKTSEEVLEICLFLFNCAYDYGILCVKRFEPDRYWLDPEGDSYLIKMLKDTIQPFLPKHEGEKLIYEMNWEGVRYIIADMPEGFFEGTPDGLAIYNSSEQDFTILPIPFISDGRGVILERNHDYIVRLTVKVPSDGTYQVNLFSMQMPRYNKFACQVPVTASKDFQEIDFEIPSYKYNEEHAYIFFWCGTVLGTTIVKQVQVVEQTKGGTSAIKAIKAERADDDIYNLAGQKVSPSYKGVVIKNGKKLMQK